MKQGRPFIFKTPEQVIEKLNSYIAYCELDTIEKKELLKSGARAGEAGSIKVARIPTILGFCVHCRISEKTFYNYINNTTDEDLLNAFYFVRDYFRQEMQDHAVVGAANPTIAAMLLGLKQKSEIETKTTIDTEGKTDDELMIAARAIEAARAQNKVKPT